MVASSAVTGMSKDLVGSSPTLPANLTALVSLSLDGSATEWDG